MRKVLGFHGGDYSQTLSAGGLSFRRFQCGGFQNGIRPLSVMLLVSSNFLPLVPTYLR